MVACFAKNISIDVDVDRRNLGCLGLETANATWFAIMKGVEGKAAWWKGAVNICFIIVLYSVRKVSIVQISTLTIFRAHKVISLSPRATCSSGLLGRT